VFVSTTAETESSSSLQLDSTKSRRPKPIALPTHLVACVLRQDGDPSPTLLLVLDLGWFFYTPPFPFPEVPIHGPRVTVYFFLRRDIWKSMDFWRTFLFPFS